MTPTYSPTTSTRVKRPYKRKAQPAPKNKPAPKPNSLFHKTKHRVKKLLKRQ